jgi:hypothetical protein
MRSLPQLSSRGTYMNCPHSAQLTREWCHVLIHGTRTKCHRCADSAPLACRLMTYIYSLCDGGFPQLIHTLTRLERINRTLPYGVNAPHLEHRFGQTCSSFPSPSQSSSPPFTYHSPRRIIFLPVPYLAPKPQRTRRDVIRACSSSSICIMRLMPRHYLTRPPTLQK